MANRDPLNNEFHPNSDEHRKSCHVCTYARNHLLLEEMLKIADAHRVHCPGETCDISLSYIFMVLNQAGIDVPKNLVGRFM